MENDPIADLEKITKESSSVVGKIHHLTFEVCQFSFDVSDFIRSSLSLIFSLVNRDKFYFISDHFIVNGRYFIRRSHNRVLVSAF